MNRLALAAAAIVLLAAPFACAPPANAQTAVPREQLDPFKDTAILTKAQTELPGGKKVGIYEFEDLECPACARAFPIVHQAIDHYKIPLIRHDFPLQMHVWSHPAAVTARYLQDKVSPEAAEQYRRDIFASQQMIASREDLSNFSKRWFDAHKLQMPFVIDPSGRFEAEVQADLTLGSRVGLIHTPTIFVLAPKGWVQVADVTQLYTVIDQALAQTPVTATKVSAPVHNNVRKAATQK